MIKVAADTYLLFNSTVIKITNFMKTSMDYPKIKNLPDMVNEASQIYGAKGLAKKVGVSERTIKNWIKSKTQPCVENILIIERLLAPWLIEIQSQPKVKDLRVLSLFSGCGGMDLGFEGGFDVISESINPMLQPELLPLEDKKGWVKLPVTRFKTVFSNDILSCAKCAWVPYFEKKGYDESVYHLESIVDLVKKARKGEFEFPAADIVTGGFPCQDFSVAGKRKGFNSHKGHHGKMLNQHIDHPTEENRGQLYMWMRHVVEQTSPRVFVAENVKGLVSLENVQEIIENDFRNVGSGYIVMKARVLHAPDYGVPQTRQRVIFIGLKKDALTETALKEFSKTDDLDPAFDPYPAKTHSNNKKTKLMPYVTVEQCLKGLSEPEKSSDLSHKTYSKAKYYGAHCQGQREVDLNQPGPTIRAEHHGNIEFRRLSEEHGGRYLNELNAGLKERRLSVRECARIQTFPDEFEFVREKSAIQGYKLSGSEGYKVIGNAVPPLLAFHIAWRLQELWDIIFKKES